ncbi:hypothetical protein P5663_06890 [Priestia flexa]|uniref:hypothetical protein n=1 Tax=Priestia flexa TaxID=86664 RepID=UPI00240E000C|nr:hypothetical protein [Priestia flexa]WEZ09565.1 hypothetical protein P5663_06890 [Priestia flexa]
MNKIKLQAKLHKLIEKEFEDNKENLCSYGDIEKTTVIMRDGKIYTVSLQVVENQLSETELVDLMEYESEELEAKPSIKLVGKVLTMMNYMNVKAKLLK